MAVTPLEAALIETWTLFTFGSIVIILRVFSRTRVVGVTGYCGDDYLIFFAWVSSSTEFINGAKKHLTDMDRRVMLP